MVRIPEEYQEVEYIENTGTQYILTNYIPTITENMKIQLDYMFTVTQTGENMIFGSSASGESRKVRFQCEYFYNDDKWYIGSGINQFRQVLSSIGNKINIRYTLFINGESLIINNQSINYTQKWTSDSNALPMCIFAINWANTIRYANRGIKIYKLIFTANGVKEAEFVPCYRKTDNEIGMYDTVSKTFYTNSGTGTFLKGHNVYYDNTNLLEQRRKILLNTPHLETASGDICSFDTDMKAPLKECKIYFNPIQEGQGDPSSDNIRPIKGWKDIEVSITNDDILETIPLSGVTDSLGVHFVVTDDGILTAEGIPTSWASAWVAKIPVIGDEILYVKYCGNISNLTTNAPALYNKYGIEITNTNISDSALLSGLDLSKYPGVRKVTIKVKRSSNNIDTSGHMRPIITNGKPLDRTYINIPFPEEAGEIYGGYIDLIKGELVSEWIMMSDTWSNIKNRASQNQETGLYYSTISTNTNLRILAAHAASEYGIKVISNINSYIYWEGPSKNPAHFFTGNSPQSLVALSLEDVFDDEQEIQFLCKLEEPIHYSLDPQILKTLRGANYIWSDVSGYINVKYWTHHKKAKDKIKRVVWNQACKPYNEDNWQAYNTDNISVNFINDVATAEWLVQKLGYQTSIRSKTPEYQGVNNVIYVSYMFKTSLANSSWGAEFGSNNQLTFLQNVEANKWYRASGLAKCKNTGSNYVYFSYCRGGTTTPEGMVCETKSPIEINLTVMFGEGNEPTLEEFETMCEKNGIDLTQYHPYDAGTIMNWIVE